MHIVVLDPLLIFSPSFPEHSQTGSNVGACDGTLVGTILDVGNCVSEGCFVVVGEAEEVGFSDGDAEGSLVGINELVGYFERDGWKDGWSDGCPDNDGCMLGLSDWEG